MSNLRLSMGRTSKGFSLLFVTILAVSSLMTVENALSQTIPKPSVPEFTLLVNDHSYDVPPSGHVNLNTGQFEKHEGFYMKNGSIELSIKNQPFTSFSDSNGYQINLYYSIRVKAHGTNNWHYFPTDNPEEYVHADTSTYTTRVFKYSMNNFEYRSGAFFDYSTFPSNGRVDFQVEAFIGYLNATAEEYFQHLNEIHNSSSTQENDFVLEYVGQSSNLSSIQTAAIPAYAFTSPNPTVAPTSSTTGSTGNPISLPLNTLFVAVAVFLAIIALILLLVRRRSKSASTNI
jgi:hypothetical protein